MPKSDLELDFSGVDKKLNSLNSQYESLQREIKKLNQQLKYVRDIPFEPLEGSIVWKWERCGKCSVCLSTTKKMDGPYPYHQWRDKNGKNNYEYLNIDTFKTHNARFLYTSQVKEIEKNLIAKEKEKKVLEQTILDLVYRLDVKTQAL